MIIQNLFNLLIILIYFKESTLLKILGINDPKSMKDLIYFMSSEEYENNSELMMRHNGEIQKQNSSILLENVQIPQNDRIFSTPNLTNIEISVEPYTDDLHLKTDADIPFFPTVDGFIPDYVQIVSAKNNDLVSFQTVQVIFEALITKLQYGIGITDIENLLFFIAFVRFLILCLKYNIKTSFLITSIGIISSYIWYRHFISISTQYAEILYRVPYTFKFMSDLYDLHEYSKTYVFNFTTPYTLIWNAIKKAGFDYETYSYVDPISMMFSLIPRPISEFTDYIYYTIYRDLGPQFIMYGKMFFKESTSLATYMFFVRINKKRCPYHIRWHWTCTLILGGLEYFYLPIIHRLTVWLITIEPAYKASYNSMLKIYTDNNLQNDFLIVKTILFTFVFIHLAFIVNGMLQAICGQYFYIPFITENTELHIGKQEKTIYSGGNMPWNDSERSTWNLRIPGYNWFRQSLTQNRKWKKLFKFMTRFKQFFS